MPQLLSVLILKPILFALMSMIFLIFITAGELFTFANNTTILIVGDNIDAVIKTMQVYSRPSFNLAVVLTD